MMDRTVGVARLEREDGTTVCERCKVAHRMLPRMKGLLGKRSLSNEEGLLIRPAPSIHTFFMRFPIDAVFVARDGEVLRVAPDVKSWRIRGCRKAYAVIELAAGEARRRGLAAGDRLVFAEAGP
jgi:uncharacterized protein